MAANKQTVRILAPVDVPAGGYCMHVSEEIFCARFFEGARPIGWHKCGVFVEVDYGDIPEGYDAVRKPPACLALTRAAEEQEAWNACPNCQRGELRHGKYYETSYFYCISDACNWELFDDFDLEPGDPDDDYTVLFKAMLAAEEQSP